MREIIFRGKRLDNGEWVYGSLFVGFKKSYICPEAIAMYNFDGALCLGGFIEVDPSTVGQYIGMEDKNGNRIFEGDIIDASNEWWDSAGPAGHDSPVILVEWENNLCGFEPFANYDCDCGVYISAKNCEVIGNIHDNPELLKRF